MKRYSRIITAVIMKKKRKRGKGAEYTDTWLFCSAVVLVLYGKWLCV